MVQEVRSIRLSTEECHAAITTILVMRNRGLRPDQVVGLDLEQGAASAGVTLRADTGAETTQVLSADDLMSAVLLFCHRARIPLPTRSLKRLAIVADGLALTTSINVRAAAPRVAGNTIAHAASGPDLTMLHTV